MPHADVAIAGAGLIGASLALELAHRGLEVVLLSEDEPLAHASTAAAGMLAVDDPDNPDALYPLSALSRQLYPGFLDRLAHTARLAEPVRFQTHETLQAIPSHPSPLRPLSPGALRSLAPELEARSQTFALLQEASLDPRELAQAIRLALNHHPCIRLHTHSRVVDATEQPATVTVKTTTGIFTADFLIDCTGAWSLPLHGRKTPDVYPRKGQLLSIDLPASLPLTRVVRTATIYVVPRLHGARAGEAVIGATVEDRGFDTSVEPQAIAALRARAAALFPALASAPLRSAWAGLRPATTDGLPLLGRTGLRTFIAKGHFRNGILLAPATAALVADLVTGDQPPINLALFSPERSSSSGHTAASNCEAEAIERDPHLV